MPLEEGDTFFFAPRPLRNLVGVDELESLSPILNCQIADLGKLRIFKVTLKNELLLRTHNTCGQKNDHF